MAVNVLSTYVQIEDTVGATYNDYIAFIQIIKFYENGLGQLVIHTSDGLDTTYANETIAAVLLAIAAAAA